MKNIDELSKDERSLLLFFETCVVDHGGLVDVRHMNSDDYTIADTWVKTGFVDFGRVQFSDIIQTSKSKYTHWCKLSENAWILAHQERRARAERLEKSRKWIKTKELQSSPPATRKVKL